MVEVILQQNVISIYNSSSSDVHVETSKLLYCNPNSTLYP